MSKYASGMDTAKVVHLIETTILRRGDGVHKDHPIRIITQYWTLDGELVAEVDPLELSAGEKKKIMESP